MRQICACSALFSKNRANKVEQIQLVYGSIWFRVSPSALGLGRVGWPQDKLIGEMTIRGANSGELVGRLIINASNRTSFTFSRGPRGIHI